MASPTVQPSAHSPAPAPLALEAVSGPALQPIAVQADKPSVMGRSSQSDIVLPDESVSRRHAQIVCLDGTWLITDLASRHGTHVNAARLTANQAAPLRTNDLIGIGPWTLRVRIGAANTAGTTGHRFVSIVDSPPAPATGAMRERVERVHERELAAITQNRLQLLIDVAAAVAGTSDEASLARSVVQAAQKGTGFPRVFMLRTVESRPDDFTVVAEVGPQAAGTPSDARDISFSRSLINAARAGEVVRLTSDAPMQAQSIMSLGIQTALCAPIAVAGVVSAFLYLDAREGEVNTVSAKGSAHGQIRPIRPGTASVHQDAAAYCSALAKMYALALGNISRQELEKRQRELVRDLEAAREAQRLIMPPERGTIGALDYAFRSRSGRYVAGDLFDVVDLGDGRIGVFLGDVAGKGISAAILMTTAQTHLNISLRAFAADPEGAARAVCDVNRHVCKHAAASRFVSLWLGVFDTRARTLSFVDAGHGHWLMASGSTSHRIESSSGIPLGVDSDYEYQAETLAFGPDNRLVVFSDGVVEQPGADGTLFGLPRTIEALAARTGDTVEHDVAAIFDAVLAYAAYDAPPGLSLAAAMAAAEDHLADDTTVASIRIA